jgi:tetratricopeptide (TPR) repeat protein
MNPTLPNSDPDDDLGDQEVRQIRRRLIMRRVLIIGLGALVILFVVLGLGLPRIKEWRARDFAAKADQLLAEGKFQQAYNNASSAVRMRPDMPEAQRSYARVLLAAGRVEGVAVLQQLLESGHGTPQDRLQLAEAGLRLGDLSLAEREASQVLLKGTNTPEPLFLIARIRLAQQRPADAMQALQECLAAGGGAQPAILYARLLFALNTPESATKASDLLKPLAQQKDEAGLEALMVLITSPALKSPEASTWIQDLRAHPLASDEQKLSAASAEIQLQPTFNAEVVKRVVAEYGKGSIEQRMQLARWLNQRREFKQVLELIPAEEATTRADLFLIRLDALAGQGDWPALATLLAGPNLPLQPPIVLLYRGRAARETGSPEEAASLYRRAMIESAPTPEVMWYVINYLQRVGEDVVLEQELIRLTDNTSIARQAFEALVPLVRKRQDAEELYRLYQRMIKALPAERIVQNDQRFFAALTGRPPDLAGAQELVNLEPNMFAYRITLALTLLKADQKEAALKVFDGITVNPAEIQPYQRAVLAAVLGANGRDTEARQLALSVPGDQVTTKEFEMITPWRKDD